MQADVVNIGPRDIDVELKPGNGHTEYIVLFISPEIPLRVVSNTDSFLKIFRTLRMCDICSWFSC